MPNPRPAKGYSRHPQRRPTQYIWYVEVPYTDRWSKFTAMVTPRQEYTTSRLCSREFVSHRVRMPLCASCLRTLYIYCACVTRSKNPRCFGYGIYNSHACRIPTKWSLKLPDDPMAKGLCVAAHGRSLAAGYHPCET